MTSTTIGLPDRYRPIDLAAPDEQTATGVIRSWRARDRVLNRDVALRVHTPGGPPAREWITRALTAGGLATPALAMVYDAAEGNGGEGAGGAAYVVNEWLDGTTLRERLATEGPLPEREARVLVRRLAEGVAEAHRVGLAVGGLTPEHVVLRPGGLAGLLSVPAATGTVAGDIAALGTLLELALTGHSSSDGSPPGIDSPDLAALVRRARSTDPANRLSSAATMVALLSAERPRTGPQDQARPDPVSDSGWLRRMRDRRDLADAAGGDGLPGDGTPGDGADGRHRRHGLPPVPISSRQTGAGRWAEDDEDDLDWESTFTAAPDDDPSYPADHAPDAGRPGRRRLAVAGLLLLALALVVGFAVWFGKNVVDVAASVDEPVGSTPSAAAPPASAPSADGEPPAAAPAQITGAELFDPFGDGEPENTDDIPRSFDGDPASAWSTLTYRGSAEFGNLKPGVGVVYDLGSPQELTGVGLTTTTPGATVEVRTGERATGELDDFAVAARGTLTGTGELTFEAPVTTRYLLVWVTGLVPADDGFSAAVAEVAPLAAG